MQYIIRSDYLVKIYVLLYCNIGISGGGYLPVDTTYPVHLLESILEDAEPAAILTSQELHQNVKGMPEYNIEMYCKQWTL